MEEIRLLNKVDVVQIIDVMKTRSNMTCTNDVKIPDYSDWLYSTAFDDPDNVIHYGLLVDGVLMCYMISKVIVEIPFDITKIYCYNAFSRKREGKKDDFGHPEDYINLINYLRHDMEWRGFYTNIIIA